MRVTVRYFAAAREAAGLEGETADLPDAATVETLRRWLRARHPALAPVEAACRYAVDEAFAAPATRLREGAVVALIPPVSGG
jgi:molybdopterin converting factor subunit 1